MTLCLLLSILKAPRQCLNWAIHVFQSINEEIDLDLNLIMNVAALDLVSFAHNCPASYRIWERGYG